ncbi:MAG: PTS sugar transporter subunit IIA [Candidatus Sumerlaeia bacterium]|nr:PTS sugar transporter subunit IIA [Candidatus Sumerlaeia bacterium]
MKLSSLLTESSILIEPEVENKEQAIERLLEVFDTYLDPTLRKLVFQRLLDREKKISSYVDHGVAIPHCKFEGLNRVLVGLITSSKGFDAQDPPGARINLLFLVLAPAERNTLMLQTLAAVARLCHTKEMRDALRRTKSPARIIKQIEESGIDVKSTITAADVMAVAPSVLSPETPLPDAISQIIEAPDDGLPVTDSQNKLLGELSSIEILAIGLPKYVDLLKDDTFLTQFEPFENYFRQEKQLTVRDVMTREILTVEEDTPIIKVTNMLVSGRKSRLYVVRDGKLCGIVYRRDLLSRVLQA